MFVHTGFVQTGPTPVSASCGGMMLSDLSRPSWTGILYTRPDIF